jgi:hypothetical protein
MEKVINNKKRKHQWVFVVASGMGKGTTGVG